MILNVIYYIKFRAFFITFGTIQGSKTFQVPIPSLPVDVPPFKIRDRGLEIDISLTRP